MEQSVDGVAEIQDEWRRVRPDVDVSPQGVIGRLHRLAGHLTAELTSVYAEHGLTEGDFDVLATLRRAGTPFERTAGELAVSTMITTGGLTKRLDRLEGAGLLERRRGDGDGRSRLVRLTDHGLAVIDAAFAAHMDNERRLVALIPVSDRGLLESMLRSWLAHFEAPDTHPDESERPSGHGLR